MGFPGIFEALLLIAMGLGYVVLYLAKREEKRLQFIGYMIGVVIIALSIIYLISNSLLQSVCPFTRPYKGMMQQQRMMQPPMPQRPPAR